MYIVVDSLTGLSLKFAKNFNYNIYHLGKDKLPENNDTFFLVTRSEGFGQIPKLTESLINKKSNLCIGVAVSGNRNWGSNFGACGDKLQEKYNIPLVCKFEGSGFNSDVNVVNSYLERINYES